MNNPHHITRTTLRRDRLAYHLDTLTVHKDAATLRLRSAEAHVMDATADDHAHNVVTLEITEARAALQSIMNEITAIKGELDRHSTYEDMALIMVAYPDGHQVFEYRDPGVPGEAAWFDVAASRDSTSGSTLAEVTSEIITDVDGNERIRQYPYCRLYTQQDVDRLIDAAEIARI